MSLNKFSGAAIGAIAVAFMTATIAIGPARADKIPHPTAVFSGLDKITGRIISFEVAANETVQFGSLQITERACYTRPATEAPQTITFAQVDEIDAKKQYKRIFSGWMFAASPGLNGIEHPVYDVWLTDCKGGKAPEAKPAETASAEPALPPPPTAEEAKAERKRKREERAAARRRAAQSQNNPDAPMDAPRREPNREPPSQSFFPDAADRRDPNGFY